MLVSAGTNIDSVKSNLLVRRKNDLGRKNDPFPLITIERRHAQTVGDGASNINKKKFHIAILFHGKEGWVYHEYHELHNVT